MELDEIKTFLRIDDNDLDGVLLSHQKAAEEYLKNAGVKVGYENALYKVAVTVFIAQILENPDLILKKGENDLRLSALIAQLR